MASRCDMKPGQLLIIALIGKHSYYNLFVFLLFAGQSLGFVVELNKDPTEAKGRAYTRYNDEFKLPTFSLTICMRFLTFYPFVCLKGMGLWTPVYWKMKDFFICNVCKTFRCRSTLVNILTF